MPINIIRAWKDRDYRSSLNEEQLAALPENPAGSVDLTDLTEGELAYMGGGNIVAGAITGYIGANMGVEVAPAVVSTCAVLATVAVPTGVVLTASIIGAGLGGYVIGKGASDLADYLFDNQQGQ